jgi:2-methylisocitrate lyase-like PEP mutase family enzyme
MASSLSPTEPGPLPPRRLDSDRIAALAAQADRLRALHQVGDPLVLVNVWDAASAQRVEAAGGRALASSSYAVAASLGVPDDNTMPPALAFGAIQRIATVATVPVTADLEGGYGLSGSTLIEGLLGAGAVGCNIEDSDHQRSGELADPSAIADRLSEIRVAAHEAGVDVVLNARIDTFLHQGDSDPARVVEDVIRRARRYIDAGADCVYPVQLTDPELVTQITREVAAPVNANLGPRTTVEDLAAAGASRISIGPSAHVLAMNDLSRRAKAVLSGTNRTFES